MGRVGSGRFEDARSARGTGSSAPRPDRAAFTAALAHAKALAASGKTADAVGIYGVLDELFHDDPAWPKRFARHARISDWRTK